MVLLNTVTLAMAGENQWVTQNNEVLEKVYLIFFTIEFVLKVISMGFISKPYSYMRDPWNFIDFLVVVSGWVVMFLPNVGANVSAIKSTRLLRIFKTFRLIPGMSNLVTSILKSLPMMLDLFVLFSFIIVLTSAVFT